MSGIIVLEAIEIRMATVLAPNTIQVEAKPTQSQVYIKLPYHIDYLGIKCGVTISQRLYSKLVMLSIPSRLRSLVSEDSSVIIQPHRLRKGVHTMFHIGTAYRCSTLGPQRQTIPTTVFESIHLLLNYVRILPDAPHKETGVLESRRVYTLISIEVTDGGGFLLYVCPVFLLLG
jgi:hypothetical protein